MTANARHLSLSAERYTPEYIVEAARNVLGSFSLDPASNHTANLVVKAHKIFTAEDNALEQKWFGRVFVNPPGTCKAGDSFPRCGDMTASGKPRRVCGCNYVLRFWMHLLEAADCGDVEAAIWIGFNCSQLQTLQQTVASPLAFFTCFINHRIKYLDESLNPLSSPPHNSYVTLVTPPGSEFEPRFVEVFDEFGDITKKGW